MQAMVLFDYNGKEIGENSAMLILVAVIAIVTILMSVTSSICSELEDFNN